MLVTGELNWVVWAAVVLGGSCIGSFLNVVIYRLPRHQSLIAPPSHCMSCGARLGPLDMIPVLSYLLLRGRCRHCHRPYSPRYALIELATGLLAAGAVLQSGLSLHALAIFICSAALLVALFVDLDHMIIPDQTVVILAVIGIALDAHRIWLAVPGQLISFSEQYGAGATLTAYLPRSLVGGLAGAGIFLFITWFFGTVLRKPVMGMGDVKLAGAMGTLLGPGPSFLAFFLLAILTGAAVGVFLIVLRIRRREDYIPFGPMLAVAGMVMLLAGTTVTPIVAHFYHL